MQDVVTVLGQMDAIEGTSLKLHPLGMVARNIQVRRTPEAAHRHHADNPSHARPTARILTG